MASTLLKIDSEFGNMLLFLTCVRTAPPTMHLIICLIILTIILNEGEQGTDLIISHAYKILVAFGKWSVSTHCSPSGCMLSFVIELITKLFVTTLRVSGSVSKTTWCIGYTRKCTIQVCLHFNGNCQLFFLNSRPLLFSGLHGDSVFVATLHDFAQALYLIERDPAT